MRERRPAATAASTARTDPRTDVAAPRTRPTELLGVLADARAAAWREATPSLLGEADAPRSAVAARDSAAVAEVARAGVRYTGLRYTVAEVATVSATPDRAVLRARIDSGGVHRHRRHRLDVAPGRGRAPRCSSTWCAPTSAGGCPTCARRHDARGRDRGAGAAGAAARWAAGHPLGRSAPGHGLGGEQVEPEPFGEELGDQLASHAVARGIQGRREGGQAALAR